MLKAAAKQLVKTLSDQALLIKQVDKPVQFSLVPFAASVNVGPGNAGASWMDVEGLSPVHQENFDWSTLDAADKRAEKIGGIWYKKGTGWGEEEGQMLTRYSLYRDMKVVTSHERVAGSERVVCDEYRSNHTCRRSHKEYDYVDSYGPFASWQGCVEARPYPYNTTDDPASGGSNNTGIGFGDPATMFVPMFAPDEPGNHWYVTQDPDEPQPVTYSAANSWWNDDPSSSTGRSRERNMAKYFMPRPINAPVLPKGAGPNYSCTTEPITPLTDVTVPEGLAAINAAIDRMAANGNTNVPEGMAWGWRTVSSGEPFTEGRPEAREGQRQGRHRSHRRRQHLLRSEQRPGRQQVDLRGLWLSAARLQRHRYRPAADRHQRRPVRLYRAATTPLRSTITWQRCATTQRRPTSWS